MRLLAVIAVWSFATLAAAQENRRLYSEPGMEPETGVPSGVCHALEFSPDGRHLLAAGLDKCLRVFPSDLSEAGQAVRWPAYREQSGAIYAMSIRPDQPRLVAVGGYGLILEGVSVLDSSSGKVVASLQTTGERAVTRALAFAPTGGQLVIGSDTNRDDDPSKLWLWDTAGSKALAIPPGPQKGRVRRIVFLDARRFLTLTENGPALIRSLDQLNQTQPGFSPTSINRPFAAASSDGRLWAIASTTRPQVEWQRLGGGTGQIEPPAPGYGPRCLAVGAGDWLAVGWSLANVKRFFAHGPSRVTIHNMRTGQSVSLPTIAGIYPASLAFSPDGRVLAVQGGDGHEIRLFDTTTGQLRRQTPTVLRSLWDVALSADGRHLGFRWQRNPTPANPNDRGLGTWQAFDLTQRRWAAKSYVFTPSPRRTTEGGWEVRPTAWDTWQVVNNQTKRLHELNLDTTALGQPMCYEFLPGPRLVIGHDWGWSLFDLTDKGPQLRRIGFGHTGHVTALAVSPNGQTLVTAGRDGTLNAWNLAPLRGGELGTEFVFQGNKLIVQSVEPGSPGWEIGLSEEDVIAGLFVPHKGVFYNPANVANFAPSHKDRRSTTPIAALESLRNVEPLKPMQILIERNGQRREQFTTCRQRPLWRFLPMADGEWMLWRYRDYFYDCSTHGDKYVGWRINGPNFADTPQFHLAERFRKRFHRPEKLGDLLASRAVDPERLAFLDLEPPVVSMTADSNRIATGSLNLSLAVKPASAQKLAAVGRIRLRRGDFQLREWNGLVPASFQVSAGQLQNGPNVLTLWAESAGGGWSESRLTIQCNPPAGSRPKPDLHWVAIGNNSYRSVEGFSRRPGDLDFAEADVNALAKAVSEPDIRNRFGQVHVRPLLNKAVTAGSIRGELTRLAQSTRPDDIVVIHLAGHGMRQANGPNTFEYLCHNLNMAQLETRLTAEDFRLLLRAIPARKLLLIDACHSGALLNDPVRALGSEGEPLTILTACGADEEAIEDVVLNEGKGAGGIFTVAVERTLRASRGKPLSLREFAESVRKQTVEFAKVNDHRQTPTIAPRPLADWLLLP